MRVQKIRVVRMHVQKIRAERMHAMFIRSRMCTLLIMVW